MTALEDFCQPMSSTFRARVPLVLHCWSSTVVSRKLLRSIVVVQDFINVSNTSDIIHKNQFLSRRYFLLGIIVFALF
jgi:hypothetical protein